MVLPLAGANVSPLYEHVWELLVNVEGHGIDPEEEGLKHRGHHINSHIFYYQEEVLRWVAHQYTSLKMIEWIIDLLIKEEDVGDSQIDDEGHWDPTKEILLSQRGFYQVDDEGYDEEDDGDAEEHRVNCVVHTDARRVVRETRIS